MRFKIAAIQFDTLNRTLENDNSTIRLEPKPYLLLQTLIAANGNTVSREQLIEEVWQGRIVTESAINKAVSTLRQHLNKLDSQTNYIETIPTVGYRLIPRAVGLVTSTKSPKRKVRFLIGGAILVSLLSALITFQVVRLSPNTKSLIPEKITSQSGIELQLSSATRSSSFSYLHPITTPLSELWLHHHGESRKLLSGNISAQALSPDASKIAFVDDENGCMVKQLTIAKQSVQSLFSCQAVERIKLIWGRNGRELIYRKRENIHNGFGLYRYDLNTHKHTQLTLPPSSGNLRGDHLFSLSQGQDRLAVATYLGEDIHRLTLYHYPQMSTEHTIELPYNPTSLTWSANGQQIYFSQANSIYSVNAQSHAVTLLHKFTAPIESLTLLDNNDTLLLNQYKLASNIKLFEPVQNVVKVVVDNQALNRLPRANQSQHIWYISDHGAHSALWSIDTNREAKTQVPLPHIFNFQRYQLNSDSSKILFEYQDAIYQFSIEQLETTEILSAELKPYVANYGQHDDEIIYSSERSGSWQLWSLNLITNQHQQLTTQGGYSGYKLNNVLYFTKFTQPGIWRLEDGQESLVVAEVPVRNWLNWRLRGNALYYEKDKSIWRFDLKTHQEKLYFTPPQRFIGQFDILQNGDVVFSELKQPSGELWQLTVKN
ncbi:MULTISPECIES: winged helix-turn-helix domain-containing protein [Pseudoalteromonas]|uniref:winged helix-turn-helix domain-containing protein n=1 Tax=Pseudoalteromonas TaxID=53246 RepID=UPI000FFE5291|nr:MULTISPECIES: winged helix-turn-helix domain-containing protein [Pseudoalteromonas]MCG9760387.1 winged helix-turn-helix domain-containing protein [Pseudoalteromonas sp. Isolate6]NKC20010.1 transcriptional regulator [Pseudoalteromonas galatheae]RXE85815.1 transcriptional regulator [Pseudoalteromonas sp. A757]